MGIFFKGAAQKLLEVQMDLKMATSQMKREAKKRLAANKKSKKEVEKFIRNGDMDTARIHAENAIRQYNEHKSYTQLAARLDAVTERVKQALAQQNMTKNMSKVVKGIGSVLKTMEVEKITKLMEQFEADQETLDVRAQYMDGAISNTVQGATPTADVNELMNSVADNIGLDISGQLEAPGVDVPIRPAQAEGNAAAAEKEL